MDASSVNTYVTGFSDKIGTVSTSIGKIIAWIFTFKNMLFIGIICLIIWAIYFLYSQETMAKRYHFNRNREVWYKTL